MMGQFTSSQVLDHEPESDGEQAAKSQPHGSFEPTVIDVLVVRIMLAKALKLPPEIVNVVLDQAEYWPHTTAQVDGGSRQVFGGRGAQYEDVFMLRSHPLGFVKPVHPDLSAYHTTAPRPRRLRNEHPLEEYQRWIGSPDPTVAHPARKIVFTIVSRDQGWCGNPADKNTYNNSWTWFEVGLERFDTESSCADGCPDDEVKQTPIASSKQIGDRYKTPQLAICSLRPVLPTLEAFGEKGSSSLRFHHDLLPSDHKIQANVVANRDHKEHRVEWRWTDDVTDTESPEARNLESQGRGKASADGEFVRSLKLGDVVTVWAKARFPNWVNHVKEVRIDLYWAV